MVLSGSSPRARGTRLEYRQLPALQRFIPAGAGNTSGTCWTPWTSTVHPRGRGEHETAMSDLTHSDGSSPRARGTPSRPRCTGRGWRFIPAGAGNTRGWWKTRPASPVHPRGRGEHTVRGQDLQPYAGSSPRARGTPCRPRPPGTPARFIPAGAGNTHWAKTLSTGLAVHPRGRGEHLSPNPAP